MKLISTFLDWDDVPMDASDQEIDNRRDPVVRCGGEPFEYHYEFEFNQLLSFIVDPRRSLVRKVQAKLDEYVGGDWYASDFCFALLRSLGIEKEKVGMPEQMAFSAMLPNSVSRCLATSYRHICDFRNLYRNVSRVINNPFFYATPGASESRLLEICEECGFAFSVDMTKEIPPADVLAEEVALLVHVEDGDEAVEAAKKRLLPEVKHVLW